MMLSGAKGLMHSMLSVYLLLFTAAAATYVLRRSKIGFPADFSIVVGFAIVALGWQYLVFSSSPVTVPSGDGGNVASIVAASLYPDRMASDPVFANSRNFSFYTTIVLPWVALNEKFTGDLGQAYMLMQVGVIFIQLIGFYLLGRRLFGGYFWSVVLALVSIPPVFIFNGELWGNLSAPLTRSVFGAMFPFLVLTALPPLHRWQPVLAMVLCGISIYVHPVSAPSVALALWLGMFAVPPTEGSWIKKLLTMILAGSSFVVMAIPFAMAFVPSMVKISSPTVSSLAEVARSMTGQQYYDALLAMNIALVSGGNNPFETWGWFYFCWAAALLFFVVGFRLNGDPKRRFFAVLCLAMLLASAGVALVDQTVANILQRGPAEIDIIRNLRFLIPILLIGFVWLLVETERFLGQGKLSLFAGSVLGVLVVFIWWKTFPTPISAWVLCNFEKTAPASGDDDAAFKSVITYLRRETAGSIVLPLPVNSFETEALAVRYAALQPVLFLRKDLNFLLYSGSADLDRWGRLDRRLTDLEAGSAVEIEATLSQLEGADRPRFILINTQKSTPALREAVSKLGKTIIFEGNWQLIEIPNSTVGG